ncbi:MAG: glycosyltransferase family 4 protein [Verrucomicrobiaceae bacterium]|nr:glycosyltransferase family 4 protein [Verrucomicrobiaceae bacterium]
MQKSLKTIHVWAPGIREGTGGIQAFCRTLVMAVKQSFPEHDLHVLLKNDDVDDADPLRALGVRFTSVAAVPAVLRTAAFAARGIAMGLVERPVCVLGAHLHFLPAIQALRGIIGTKYAGFLYGIEAWNVTSKHRIRAMCAADGLVAISWFTRDHVVKHHHVEPGRCRLVPCTFDVERFAIGAKPPDLLERYGIKPGQPVLLTVSRLALSERYKGHRQVFVAMRRILESHPDAVYVVAGQGDDLVRLKDEAQVMGLEDHVKFIGHVAVAELPALYRMCDLFVMPSSKEGFGIVFLEAMATGKPVIAGNIDGSVDAVDHGRLGALVDPNCPMEIGATACQILERSYPNPLMFQPEALREAVREQFGYARVSRLFAEFVRPLTEDDTTASSTDSAALPSPPNEAPIQRRGLRIAVLTHLTSPYQVEFFNAINASGLCSLDVVYLTSTDRSRQWAKPALSHAHMIVDETPECAQSAMSVLATADVTIFNFYTHAFALKAIRKRAATGLPWAFWGERPGFMHLGLIGRLQRKLLLGPLHACRAPIWGVGKFGVAGYQSEFGPDHEYVDIPYFSDISRFECPRNERSTARKFLFCGAMIPRKGVEELARAFKRLAANSPDVRIVFVGDGPLVPKLKAILSGCASQVEWAGFQPWEKLPGFYAEADVFCFPSRYDGWGLAAVEALASGLPVISTDETGAALEFVKEGSNGWLVPPGKEEALLAAMKKAVSLDQAELAVMREAARVSVTDHSLECGAARFIEASQRAALLWRRVLQ